MPEALKDRLGIWDYIAADNSQVVAKMDEQFSQAVSASGSSSDRPTGDSAGHAGTDFP